MGLGHRFRGGGNIRAEMVGWPLFGVIADSAVGWWVAHGGGSLYGW